MQSEEIGEHWTLGAEDLAWLSGMPDAGKLGLAVQLMCWRRNGRFPDDEADPAPAVVKRPAHAAIKVILRSKDAREGSKAFMEKRKPNFTGE